MTTAITAISGIGPGTAKLLMDHGFKSLQDVAGTTIEKLSAVPGFGPVRAGRTIKAANEALSPATDSTVKPVAAGRRTARKPAAKKAAKPAAKPASAVADSEETKQEAEAKKLSKKEKKKLKKAEKAAAKKAKKAKKSKKGKSKKKK